MNKKSILERLESSREDFLDVLDPLPESALLEPNVVGEWSIKDILAHLSRWEAELIKMLWQIHQNQKPTSIHFEKNINIDRTNAEWFEEGRLRPLERILDDFHSVRNQTILNVEKFSDRDLSDTKRYQWLKNKPLSRYIANDSFEHEEEHLEEIKNWIKKK